MIFKSCEEQEKCKLVKDRAARDAIPIFTDPVRRDRWSEQIVPESTSGNTLESSSRWVAGMSKERRAIIDDFETQSAMMLTALAFQTLL